MNLFFIQNSQKDHKEETAMHTLVPLIEEQHNITDGAEFLDDALRMKEQPFIQMRAEESIAPGGPDGLL
jgi:hypothetical protein